MNFLSWSRRSPDSNGPQTASDVIDKLSERLKTATMIEDLRSAVVGLKGYAKLYPLEVGTMGMSSLVTILKVQSQAEESVHEVDTELIQNILETLHLICQKRVSLKANASPRPLSASPFSSQDFSGQFTEILIKDPMTVSLFLELFKYSDFYIRYHTILLLSTLLSNKPALLKECILASPSGLSKLIDLLEEPREALRNEGLLLLISLTLSNTEIQKIIAFENTFDRLLDLIQAEGGLAGEYVVSDCFLLIFNLLEYNVSNQSYFRETSCIQRLVALLPTTTVPMGSSDWSEERERHTLHLLKVIRSLIVPSNPNTVANQSVFGNCGLLAALLPLTLQVVSVHVASESLSTMGDLIRSHAGNQRLFSLSRYMNGSKSESKSTVGLTDLTLALSESPFPIPSLLALCMICLDRSQPLSHRLAAAYVFECFCLNHADGQIAIASTWIPPPSLSDGAEKSFVSTGSLILAALLDRESTHRDPLKLWFASLLLSLTLSENEVTKSLAIKYTFSAELCAEFEGMSLMHYVVQLLIKLSKDSVDLRILSALYILLIDWMIDSPASVSHFLAESSHLQFLMESMRQSSHSSPELTGLATFLYGCLILYQVDDMCSDPSPGQESEGISSDYLKSILKSRLGYEVACSRLLRLRECAGWHASMHEVSVKWSRSKRDDNVEALDDSTQIFDSDQPLIWFDPMSCTAMKSRFDEILSVFSVSSSNVPVKKSSHVALTDNLKSSLKSQETLIVSLKSQLSVALDNLNKGQNEAAAELARLRSEIATLKSTIDMQSATIMNFESEQEDLLVCLAELDHENAKLKQLLQDSGIAVKESNMTARERSTVMESLELAERENRKREIEHKPDSLSPRLTSSPNVARTEATATATTETIINKPTGHLMDQRASVSLNNNDSHASTMAPPPPPPPPRGAGMMKMVRDTFLPPSPGTSSSFAEPKMVSSEPPMAILVETSLRSPLLASRENVTPVPTLSPTTSPQAAILSMNMPPPSRVLPVVPPFMMVPPPPPQRMPLPLSSSSLSDQVVAETRAEASVSDI